MSLVTRRMRKHAYSTGYMKKQPKNSTITELMREISKYGMLTFSLVAVQACERFLEAEAALAGQLSIPSSVSKRTGYATESSAERERGRSRRDERE